MNSSISTRPVISDQQSGPIVNIVTWLLLVISVLAMVARLSTKWSVSHRLNLDDLLLGIGLIIFIANGISTSVEAANGLGAPITSSSDSQLLKLQKARYAAELCYIVSVCFSKLSALAFLHMLTPSAIYRRLCIFYGTFTLAWAGIAFITEAFQCSVPNVWITVGNKCFDILAFWMFFLILEIISNVFLMALPFGILWGLHVGLKQKIAIWCCFGSRIFVVAALVAQLVLFNNAYKSTDFFFHAWKTTTIAEVVLCLLIVTPCLPYLKPFLESIDSGMLRNDGIRRLGQSEIRSQAYGSSFGLQKFTDKSRAVPASSIVKSKELSNPTAPTGTLDGDMNVERDQGIGFNPSLESNTSQSKIIKNTTVSWTYEQQEI